MRLESEMPEGVNLQYN